jgi:hypothetical protein
MRNLYNISLRIVAIWILILWFSILPTQQTPSGLFAQSSEQSLYLPLVISSIAPVIPSTTIPLDRTILETLIAVSEDGVYTFGTSSPILEALNPGDIIVGDVSSLLPYGFLRQVVNVESHNGQIIVHTNATTLDQAIMQGGVSVNRILTPEMIESSLEADGISIIKNTSDSQNDFYFAIENVILFDADQNTNTTSDQIRANGNITLASEVNFGISIKESEIKEIVFTSHVTETSTLEISSAIELASFDTTYELARYRLTPIRLFVGTVPIIIVPVMTLSVGADGNVSVGVTTGVTQEATFLAGVQYSNDTWREIGQSTNNFAYTPPTFSSSLNLKGYVNSRLALLLYGVAGSYIDADAYLELSATTSNPPSWRLFAGLDVGVGFLMELLSEDIESPNFTVIQVRELIAGTSTTTPTPEPTVTPIPKGLNEIISMGFDGTPANGNSYYTDITPDGRYILFVSNASNLTLDDTDDDEDNFVYDNLTGSIALVNLSELRYDIASSISDDGRYVINRELRVLDRLTGISEISVTGVDGEPIGTTDLATISGNGRYIVFVTSASNVIINDTNPLYRDVFVHDRLTGATEVVSVDSNGEQGIGDSAGAYISYDGRYVTFNTTIPYLVENDTNNVSDAFRHDRETGITTRVSINSEGIQGNGDSVSASISCDGRYVGFQSKSTNLDGNNTDDNEFNDVFVHDTLTGLTDHVSYAFNGTSANEGSYNGYVSCDGRFVGISSYASNLVPNDTNFDYDVFVFDRLTRVMTVVSVSAEGEVGNGYSGGPIFSDNGRLVVFQSVADNLVPNDTNKFSDIFLYER